MVDRTERKKTRTRYLLPALLLLALVLFGVGRMVNQAETTPPPSVAAANPGAPPAPAEAAADRARPVIQTAPITLNAPPPSPAPDSRAPATVAPPAERTASAEMAAADEVAAPAAPNAKAKTKAARPARHAARRAGATTPAGRKIVIPGSSVTDERDDAVAQDGAAPAAKNGAEIAKNAEGARDVEGEQAPEAKARAAVDLPAEPMPTNHELVLHDELGPMMRLDEISYDLDGEPLWSKTFGGTQPANRVDIPVTVPLQAGTHQLLVNISCRLNDFGVFKYAENYRVRLTSRHAIQIRPGQTVRVVVVPYEDSIVQDPLKRLRIRFEERQTALELGAN